jgi:hypothetical protein
MRTVTTGAKAFMLLGATAGLSVFGNASVSWAQYYNPGALGSVERCNLSGVNPYDHPNIFSVSAVARSYGFVQVNGTWRVSRSLCGRRSARARPNSSSSYYGTGYYGGYGANSGTGYYGTGYYGGNGANSGSRY